MEKTKLPLPVITKTLLVILVLLVLVGVVLYVICLQDFGGEVIETIDAGGLIDDLNER